MEITTISDSDDRYQVLSDIQRRYCEDEDIEKTHPCKVERERCASLVSMVAEENFPEDSDTKNMVETLCLVRATPYEMTGVHWLLSSYWSDLIRILEQSEFPKANEPVYGALPLPGLHASIESDAFEYPLILINVTLLSFINELLKVSAQAIPVQRVGQMISIDTSDEALQRNLDDNKQLVDYFYSKLSGALGGDSNVYLPPNGFSRTVQVVYTNGLELLCLRMNTDMPHYLIRLEILISAIFGRGSIALRLTRPHLMRLKPTYTL